MLPQITEILDQAFSERIAGNWEASAALCDAAFRLSMVERSPHDLTEAVLARGHCYRDMGEYELATEHLSLAHQLATLQNDNRRAARSLNGLAVLFHLNGGNYSLAEDTYQQALKLAVLANDPLTIGNVYQNLGTIANIRGDLDQALEYYRSSLKEYEAVSHEGNLASVLNNLGMLYTDLHRYVEAQEHLDRALSIAIRSKNVVTESVVHTNRTELFIALNDLRTARESCDEAFEISSRIGDNRIKAESLKFYGVIYREGDKPHLAEIHLRQAIATSTKYAVPLTEAESHRELALVLRAQERNQEALESLNRAHGLFSALQATPDQADVGKRLSQLEDDFLSLVRIWGESIEAKDRYTSGHCQRVADYACRIASAVGVSDRDLVWFRMGAFLHDVGKTAVPEEILNKRDGLTAEEREIIEQHTVVGHEMLSSTPFPWDILPMVRSHHERWDGTGYPDRLSRTDIPFAARILHVADVFDALTSTRSYREPISAEEAFEIMDRDRGSFDPALFEVFRGLLTDFNEMAGDAH